MGIRLLSALSLLFLSSVAPALTVVLDPGHGGIDTGAQYGKAKESELVLNIAKELESLLKKDPQFQVFLTRTNDTALSLPARVLKAQDRGADLFISLHANAALDVRAQGAEFFFQNSVAPDKEALYLAHQENQLLQAEADLTAEAPAPSKKADISAILDDLHRQNRLQRSFQLSRALTQTWSPDAEKGALKKATIKQAPFYVISNTKMPSVLVEIGFLSNPKEVRQLMRSDYQAELAQKIYKAIVLFKTEKTSKEKIDKPTHAALD